MLVTLAGPLLLCPNFTKGPAKRSLLIWGETTQKVGLAQGMVFWAVFWLALALEIVARPANEEDACGQHGEEDRVCYLRPAGNKVDLIIFNRQQARNT